MDSILGVDIEGSGREQLEPQGIRRGVHERKSLHSRGARLMIELQDAVGVRLDGIEGGELPRIARSAREVERRGEARCYRAQGLGGVPVNKGIERHIRGVGDGEAVGASPWRAREAQRQGEQGGPSKGCRRSAWCSGAEY